eukprot:gnl/MRDRNA2_/MRDRNA2_97996_c0_seq1.p1 gnl/MRDRNA2_/MRDRNA2_97996_c0~~gnl/MRDRNA2_/MRDRNA2_97996_c0_seq1.p1  ORF type:complete len:230 (+),score=39.12 gnl/MRDRNA2_/MRDRNA2_97996_c0_seq1:75-764(+)
MFQMKSAKRLICTHARLMSSGKGAPQAALYRHSWKCPLAFSPHCHRGFSTSGFESPYEVLMVERTASAEEIRTAYLARVRILHPDNQPTGSVDEDERKRIEDAFKELQGAWHILGDASRRLEFDTYGTLRAAPADWSPRMWSLLQKTTAEEAVVMPNWGPSEPPMWLAMFGLASALGGAILWQSRNDIMAIYREKTLLRNGGWVCPNRRCLRVNEADASYCQMCGRPRS